MSQGEERALHAASVLTREQQHKIIEASAALHTTLELGALLQVILNAAADGVEAERGTVFLVSQDGNELWSRVMDGEQSLEIRLPMGKGIAGAVGATGETIRIADAYDDARFDQSWDKKSGFRTRQILAAPIRNRQGETVGVFQLLNKRKGDFGEGDEAYLEALSLHAALAVENATLHESELERERQDREIAMLEEVQRSFQPETQTRDDGVFSSAGMNILCEDASGDYYDFIELPDDHLGVAIGDVSGHGLHSALVMAQGRSLLRAFCSTENDLALIVNRVNDFMARDMVRGRFMTLFVGVFDTAKSEMAWISAGHLPSLVMRADGSVERLASVGRVLGIFPKAGYVEQPRVAFAPGDMLFLYTDGVTEASPDEGDVENPNMFGEERLTDLLKTLSGQPPMGILEGVRDALRAFTGRDRLKDDLTMIVVTRPS